MRVGLGPPIELFEAGLDGLRATVRRAEELGLDHVTTGNHVSFHDGFGDDGFVQATSTRRWSRWPRSGGCWERPP